MKMGIIPACFNLEGKNPLSTEMFGIKTTCDISKLSQRFVVIFMPNITTNHAITCTSFRENNTDKPRQGPSPSRMTEQTQILQRYLECIF